MTPRDFRSVIKSWPNARLNSEDPVPYLQNPGERMIAFQLPDDKYIFGSLYINQYGAFMRRNGTWIEAAPSDSTFDGTTPYVVRRDKAEQFVEHFDRGALTVAVALEFFKEH
jgi:hypothetical protein